MKLGSTLMNKAFGFRPLVLGLALSAPFYLAASHEAFAQAAATSAPAAQHNKIEGVDVVQRGALSVVRFHFQAPLTAVPANFAIGQPASISFDFPNVVNGTGYRHKDIAQGDLRSLRMAELDGRTRAVLSLRAPMNYEASIKGSILEVVVTPVALAAGPSAPALAEQAAGTQAGGKPAAAPAASVAAVDAPKAVSPATAPAGAKTVDPVVVAALEKPRRFSEGGSDSTMHSIREIDFRRGANGEGKVIVDMSDNSAPVDIKQKGKQLVVEFIKTSVADALKKKLNVVDFGTPVQVISTTTSGDKTTMILEPKGDWKYNAYQSDKRLIIEVAAVVNDPSKLVPGDAAGYHGAKISLDFQNIDVRALLNVIGDYTNLNVIVSDSVQGSITLHLKDVPWDQVLDTIMQMRGLDMRKRDSVIWIAPRDEITKREKDMLESRQQISDIEPLRTESFQLNYTTATDLAALLTNKDQRILSKRGTVVVDPRTNQVFVTDIESGVEQAKKIISKVDIYMRQVQIEARIVEASDTFSKALGARLGWNNTNKVRGLLGPNDVNISSNPLAADGTFQTGGMAVNLPAPSNASGAANGVMSLVLFNHAATRFLNLELSALEADGRGKIVSSPRVVTADQEKALIEQGTELPYQQASSSGATAVSFRKANLKLEVKPQITPDGHIIMEVEINKDAPGASTVGGIAINTKHVKTKVLIENGGTVVIGGIYIQEERTDVNKVPLLGDLPIAGNLFRNKNLQDNKTELLIFLTPNVLDTRISSGK